MMMVSDDELTGLLGYFVILLYPRKNANDASFSKRYFNADYIRSMTIGRSSNVYFPFALL